MNLTRLCDKEFHSYLLDNDVLTMRMWNQWPKPDEGTFFPLLLQNFAQLDVNAYIIAGLKANPLLMRIPKLEPDWQYFSRFSYGAVNALTRDFQVIPMRLEGQTNWLGVAMFHPFNPTQLLPTLELTPSQVAWQILTPPEFDAYENKFQEISGIKVKRR